MSLDLSKTAEVKKAGTDERLGWRGASKSTEYTEVTNSFHRLQDNVINGEHLGTW